MNVHRRPVSFRALLHASMRITFILFITTILLLCSTGAYCFGTGIAKITVKVVDETGEPVSGATVGFGFYVGGEKKEAETTGVTDVNGNCSASSQVIQHVGGNVTKEGYYLSLFSYNFRDKKFAIWQPWNPTIEVVLRKIENPVPMYARDTVRSKLEIPVIGKEIGLDLSKFDWVAPYGQGTYSDFIIKVERNYESDNQFEVTLHLSFVNEFDGIQEVYDRVDESNMNGSLFRLPRYAPLDGYKKHLTKINYYKLKSKEKGNNYDENINYIFRVRSEHKDNILQKAMYGKLRGDVEVDPRGSKTAVIYFKYYLNPDYSRNLEFDPKRNLFGTLPMFEQVKIY